MCKEFGTSVSYLKICCFSGRIISANKELKGGSSKPLIPI